MTDWGSFEQSVAGPDELVYHAWREPDQNPLRLAALGIPARAPSQP